MELELRTDKMRAWARDGIGWMVYNNPERRNAVSLEMWQAIGDIIENFEQDSAIRVVAMRGAGGKAFVSGADISEFDRKRGNAKQMATYGGRFGTRQQSTDTAFKAPDRLHRGLLYRRRTRRRAECRRALRDSGLAFRHSCRQARGSATATKVLAKLSRVVGPTSARDILLSARFLDAEEALRIGLINFIESRETIVDTVTDYADRIARNAPLTVKAAKAAINAWEKGGVEEDLDNVRRLVSACFDSEDYKEGRRAFAEKRTPQFGGR